MAKVLILLSMVLLGVCVTEQTYFFQQKFIDEINREATTWKAGVNFNSNIPTEHILKMLQPIGSGIKSQIDAVVETKTKYHSDKNSNNVIPKYFDARTKWTKCKTIGHIPNQGRCANAWAVAPSSAFADRLCVSTDGKFNQHFSAEKLTFCCDNCLLDTSPCEGGFSSIAWSHITYSGLVTGGDYNTTDGCQPYRVPPFKNGSINSFVEPPYEPDHQCQYTCYGDKNIKYEYDIKRTKEFYLLSYPSIQNDILAYGPLSATFVVYDDFLNYKSGVYVKSENAKPLGVHTVKVIGWGEDKGVPYWLMINSWGPQWGNNGLFKIRRGTNECEIDRNAMGGVPDDEIEIFD